MTEIADRLRAVLFAHVDSQHVAVGKLIERELVFPHFRSIRSLGLNDAGKLAFPTEKVGDRSVFDLLDVPDRAAVKTGYGKAALLHRLEMRRNMPFEADAC
ncbi:hypothetical protein D9M71_383830 [compost metagenome]